MPIRVFAMITRDACVNSIEDRVPRLGAALAFYLTFSLAPLLLIAVVVAGVAYGRQFAEGRLLSEIRPLVGDDLEVALKNLISITARPRSGFLATGIATATVLFGAIGFFCELQDALNSILGTSANARPGIWRLLQTRLLSFGLIVGSGILLLASVAISTIAFTAAGWLNVPFMSVLARSNLIHLAPLAGSFAVISILFAMIYRFLPDVWMPWRSIWFGAILSSLLFAAGKLLLGFYLAQIATASIYGTAASIITLMLWNYYSVQVFLYGAELVKAHARNVQPVPQATLPAKQL